MILSPQLHLIRRQALSKGFPDPVELMETLGRFSQPSEVKYPVELLRAGAAMHARGLINSGVIQYNMDWKWPYWVLRQYNPQDVSFIPRAFSITHINLTQRNWTAVGLPGNPGYPIVDPGGILTPFWGSWSVDVWCEDETGRWLTTGEVTDMEQSLEMESGLALRTRRHYDGLTLDLHVHCEHRDHQPVTVLRASVHGEKGRRLAVSIRPFNPEGVSLVSCISMESGMAVLDVDGTRVTVSRPADRVLFSDYASGDVFHFLSDDPQEGDTRDARQGQDNRVVCGHGMATAAMVLGDDGKEEEPGLEVCIPMHRTTPLVVATPDTYTDWNAALSGATRFTLPDGTFQYLSDAALHTLVLLSPGDVYPGSYTYKRFWFRDAAFMIHALLAAGLIDRAREALGRFSPRQLGSGYYRSQEGEWDSNGQVLWIYGEFFRLTGEKPDSRQLQSLIKGGEWIGRKRIRTRRRDHPCEGLLPAGFSAEHLGPNDYYYWDDFWSVAGLQALADLCADAGRDRLAHQFRAEARDLLKTVTDSLKEQEEFIGSQAMPAAPRRRLDAGSIGSLVSSYPLKLFAPDDRRLEESLTFLMDNCRVDGGFYQEMIHSGINAYLTLHMAQAGLRAGRRDWFSLVRKVADLATDAGQWPEAVNTLTGGGCMGDGQHGWAAAEWYLMMRNMFVREEDGTLLLGTGIPAEWIESGRMIACTDCKVPGGTLSLSLSYEGGQLQASWQGEFASALPRMEFRVPGFGARTINEQSGSVGLQKE